MIPLVSVVLPTYNRARWLPSAIASVRAQTQEDWELLVVDDGSTDDSLQRLPRDARISVIALAHSGNLAIVRQAGLAVARGTFVAALDSDDEWESDHLARAVTCLEQERAIGWCYGRYDLISESGDALPFRAGSARLPRAGDLLPLLLSGEAPIALEAVLVRRELAQAVGFDCRLPLYEDYDFLVRLALRSPVGVVDALVAHAREHEGRTTRQRYDQMLALAAAYGRYRTEMTEPALRRLCRFRARYLLRQYLARARAEVGTVRALVGAARGWRRTKRLATNTPAQRTG